MFARGFATKNCLRAFLLAGMVLFAGSTSQIRAADTIYVDYLGQNSSGGITVHFSPSGTMGSQQSAGCFNWRYISGSSATMDSIFDRNIGPGTRDFISWCIDPTGLQDPSHFEVTAVNQNPPITNTIAQQLDNLVEKHYNNTDLNSDTKLAAFQLTVWKLVYSVSNVGNGIIDTLANQWYIDAQTAASTNNYSILYLIDQQNQTATQNQFVVLNGQGQTTPPVPAPAGVVLAGMAFACVGGYNFLRRRKIVAAV